ncbi:MAG: hypothetical protein DHS80DRAFT_23916 [Piptocephalis tieghemiana]|nr:MAG: hypothetical protein DHS80DRAFT_23916 [Piptocephalis tieghemiana]
MASDPHHPIVLFSLHTSYLLLSHLPSSAQGILAPPLLKGLTSLLHPLLRLACLTAAAEGVKSRGQALAELTERTESSTSPIPPTLPHTSSSQTPSKYPSRTWSRSEFARACAYGLIGPFSSSSQGELPRLIDCVLLFLLSLLSLSPRPLLVRCLSFLSLTIRWIPGVEAFPFIKELSGRLVQTVRELSQAKTLFPPSASLQSLYHLPLPTALPPSTPIPTASPELSPARSLKTSKIAPLLELSSSPSPSPPPTLPLSPLSSRSPSNDASYFSGEGSNSSRDGSFGDGTGLPSLSTGMMSKEAREKERKKLKKKRQQEKKKQSTHTTPHTPISPSSPPTSPLITSNEAANVKCNKPKIKTLASQTLEKRAGSRANYKRRKPSLH